MNRVNHELLFLAKPTQIKKYSMTTPRQTIYINNLNEKVSINKLKKELQLTFDTCGKILQISALKTLKLKGQAFITFEDIPSATKALEFNKKDLLAKPMNVTYAKSDADVISTDESIAQRKELRSKKRKLDKMGTKNDKQIKKLRDEWKELPPNHILLIQNLEHFDDLKIFFEKFAGFDNVRLVKVKSLAFIEFENEELAKSCLDQTTEEALIQFGHDVILSFAKK
ncbi:U2 small nuclear ribonucleoprotein, putative [Candida dubliniensis CD36]|uniref:U2 small nuclear ribonucleoprotein, putative n=1 Tax=Candida dubliniensis (strain CD36 / ATCC MYA-646 / CBS 7987 / NCPF 3949 / NRRL Y-17841) TaxID=573826 RepID=B9WEH4_CANDC|nr:U2 small nuclear ribonucleoprotein, putative [Candida dubliniensis CD36]CAX43086.1 U2 small nuclear ribonucleoprotein, putative [Candida dubliniensis CD36]